ncbi:MAG: hypothetical protein WD070_09110, partial [Pirellulaceae bacterium]
TVSGHTCGSMRTTAASRLGSVSPLGGMSDWSDELQPIVTTPQPMSIAIERKEFNTDIDIESECGMATGLIGGDRGGVSEQ